MNAYDVKNVHTNHVWVFLFVQPPDNVVQYELVGDELAQEYFLVNPLNGEVSVRRSLLNNDAKRYTVRSRTHTHTRTHIHLGTETTHIHTLGYKQAPTRT